MTHQQDYDLLVIGSGAAGLALALELADELKICVLAKADLSESNTRYAQGGVSAVMDPGDSIESHIEDTLKAGAGLCQRPAVEHIVRHGQAAINWLQSVGVPFTTVKDEHGVEVVHLTQEGGHSRRRVVHADDATGLAIETTLLERVKSHPNIQLLDWHIAIDLITMGKLGATPDRCVGAYVLDRRSNTVITLRAHWCVLATGGAGKVYLYTSNPDIATGDGVAMA